MKKTVLLIYSNYSSFVAKDVEILEKEYNVVKYRFKLQKQLTIMIWELLKQLFFIIRHIWSVDIVYSWFSDFYTLIPFAFARMLGKKTIIVVGGYDAVSIPKLKYGLFYKRDVRQMFGKASFRLSDYILPVDESLIQSTNYFADKDGIKVGVKNYVLNLRARFQVVPTGYDTDFWKAIPLEREKSVLAFGYASSMQKFVGKGHEFLIRVAACMPDVRFNIIGVGDNIMPYAESIATPNVTLYNSRTQKELLIQLSQNKVYALFSMSEGMPSSVCEAMLMGCVAVGSNVGGIKNIIGDCGYVLDHDNIEQAAELIQNALESDGEFVARGRKRIIDLFPSKLRETKLYEIIG